MTLKIKPSFLKETFRDTGIEFLLKEFYTCIKLLIIIFIIINKILNIFICKSILKI